MAQRITFCQEQELDLENKVPPTVAQPPETLFLQTSTTLLTQVHTENDSRVYFMIVLTTDYCWSSWTCRIAAPYKFYVDWLIDWLKFTCSAQTFIHPLQQPETSSRALGLNASDVTAATWPFNVRNSSASESSMLPQPGSSATGDIWQRTYKPFTATVYWILAASKGRIKHTYRKIMHTQNTTCWYTIRSCSLMPNWQIGL